MEVGSRLDYVRQTAIKYPSQPLFPHLFAEGGSTQYPHHKHVRSLSSINIVKVLRDCLTTAKIH